MSKKKLLNLDELAGDEIVIILNGNEHKLKESTVEDFIANAKDIESVGKSASIEEEMELSKKMLKRSFPTLKDEDIMNLTMPQINKLVQFARDAGGESKVEEEIKQDAAKEGGAATGSGESSQTTTSDSSSAA